MGKKENFDIIIVGAGPGGSIAAKTAAEKGYTTLLLEKESLENSGRYKACGGALAWELVEEIKYPQEKIARVIESLELHHIDGEIYSKKGKGAVVWRSVFDKHLTDMAILSNAKCYDAEPLTGIKQENQLYRIQTPKGVYQTKYIIAADGVNSPTLTQLNWSKFAPKDLVLTITHEMQTIPRKIAATLGDDKVHLFFGVDRLIKMGYAWLFPKADTITMGWGNRLDLITNTKQEFQRFARLPFVRNALVDSTSKIFKPHLIPVGIRSQLYNQNVFAVGDAAGMVDPISGKGIPYAMLSGQIAIETIHKAEQKGTLDKLNAIYERNLNGKFLSVLKAKQMMREKIFANDTNLKHFLTLWETHRSSEIIVKKLLIAE